MTCGVSGSKFPDIDQILSRIPAPAGFTFHEIARSDISEVISLLRNWYPTIQSGMESVHLLREHYLANVGLRNEPRAQQRDVVVLAKRDERIVGLYSVSVIIAARQLSGRLIAIAPEFRRSGLSLYAYDLFDGLADAIDAGLIWGTATLSHDLSQHTMEKRGFRLCGIFPAYDIDTLDTGERKFVCEALYCKVRAPLRKLERPPEDQIIPHVRQLWDFLRLDELFQVEPRGWDGPKKPDTA